MENKATIKKIFEVAEDYRPLGRPIMTATKDFDDAMDGGIRGGELITISGLSGHGKTSYALWLTKQIVDSGVPCLWFSYEMNPWYLKEKLVALGATEDFSTYVPIKHSENTAKWIKEKILEAKNTHACQIVFIDHLHYLIPPNTTQNTALLIGGIVRDLKTLAVETDTVIYLVAHMRKLEMGEKVNINAVRDSALIINESDYVYLVERLKPKVRRGEKDEVNPLEEEFTNYTKIVLAKNRRTGRVFSRFFEVKNGDYWQLDKEVVKTIL